MLDSSDYATSRIPGLSTDNYQIRAARNEDLKALLELENRSFSSEKLSRARLRHWINAANGIFLLSTDAASQLLGSVLLITRKNSRRARVYSLAVNPQARGKGIGRKLMLSAQQSAKAAGYTAIGLEVASDNSNAIALYESLGYQRLDYIKGYYEDGRDAHRLQLTLK